MYGKDMKGLPDIYEPGSGSSNPPPYSPHGPSVMPPEPVAQPGPTVMQPAPTIVQPAPTIVQPAPTIVQPALTSVVPSGPTLIHGPGVVTVKPPGVSAIVVWNELSSNAISYMCRSCNKQVVTRVEYRASTKTHVFASLLCLVGFWPCVFLPYCTPSCTQGHHYCPNCNAIVGTNL